MQKVNFVTIKPFVSDDLSIKTLISPSLVHDCLAVEEIPKVRNL